MAKLALLVVLVLGCGSVTPKASDDGAAGAGGQLEAGGAGGELGGRGGELGGATAGAGGHLAGCLPYNTQGFALDVDKSCSADAGRCLPTDPRCCYAHCELNGAQFIGCADDATGTAPTRCYASCAECP